MEEDWRRGEGNVPISNRETNTGTRQDWDNSRAELSTSERSARAPSSRAGARAPVVHACGAKICQEKEEVEEEGERWHSCEACFCH